MFAGMLKQKEYFPVVLLVGLALIWGSSFILMKRGLLVYSAAQVASMRMFFSFICLLPLTLRYLPKMPLKKYGMLTLVGVLGNGLPAILFATAQTHLSSSVAGVLNSLTTLFTLIVAALFFKQHFSNQKVIGVFLGFLGALILILMRSGGSAEGNYIYGILILLATICYAWSVNLIKTYLSDVPSLGVSSMALLFVGPAYGYYLFAHTDFALRVQLTTGAIEALFYVFLLAFFGTAIALVLFNKLVALTTPVYAASVSYLIPMVALGWGLLDGEQIGVLQIVGMIAILAGVFLANRKT